MSGQHVIADYRAYFASLGPGRPFTPEQLEAMAALNPAQAVLILDETPGQLMVRLVLEQATCLDEALLEWSSRGMPRAWLQLGNAAPWTCDAAARPTRGRVGSRA